MRAALDRNLCRCGAHNRIVRAVLRAAKEAKTVTAQLPTNLERQSAAVALAALRRRRASSS